MIKITRLLELFIDGLDKNDFNRKDIAYAIDFGRDMSINTVYIYDTRIASIEDGIGRAVPNHSAALIFQIYWTDGAYEFWASRSTCSMHLTEYRLNLIRKIIKELNRYSNKAIEVYEEQEFANNLWEAD